MLKHRAHILHTDTPSLRALSIEIIDEILLDENIKIIAVELGENRMSAHLITDASLILKDVVKRVFKELVTESSI